MEKTLLKNQFSKSSKSPIGIMEKSKKRNDKNKNENSFIHKSFDQRNTISSSRSNKRILSSNSRRNKNIKLDNIKQIEINLNSSPKKDSNKKINSERLNIEYKNSFVNNSSFNNSGNNFYKKNKEDNILKNMSQTDRMKNSNTFIQNKKSNLNSFVDKKNKKSPIQKTRINFSPTKKNSNSHYKNEKLANFSPINTNKEKKKFILKNIINSNDSPRKKNNIKNENNNTLNITNSNNNTLINNKNNNNKIIKPSTAQTQKNLSSKHSNLKSIDKNDLKSSFNINNKKTTSHKVIINECFNSIHSNKENKEIKNVNIKKSKSLKKESGNKNDIIISISDKNKVNKNKENKNKKSKLSPLTQPAILRSKSRPNDDINKNKEKKNLLIDTNEILNHPIEIIENNIGNINKINFESINNENNIENIINNNHKEINIENLNYDTFNNDENIINYNNNENNENIMNYNNNENNENIMNYNNNEIINNININNEIEIENKKELLLNNEEKKEKNLNLQNLQKLKEIQEIKQQLSQKNYKENELESPKKSITFDKNYSSPTPSFTSITNKIKIENPKSKTEKLENEKEIKFPIQNIEIEKEKKNPKIENPNFQSTSDTNYNKILPNIKSLKSYLKKGYSPSLKKPNQDSIFISKLSSSILFLGVCDGHGTIGHEISSLIEKELPKILQSKLSEINIYEIPLIDLEKIIISSFKETNDKISLSPNLDSVFSGSTCCSLIITEKKIISCNLGDSRGIIGKKNNKEKKWLSENLTNDHKPDLIEEKNRILKNGGRVQSYIDENGNEFGPVRVWKGNENIPGLAMSRSFGDEIAHGIGVICEPEIKEKIIDDDIKFFVVASDGVWEFISSQECVDIVSKFYECNNVDGALVALAEESRKRWIKEEDVIDDISIVVGFFN